MIYLDHAASTYPYPEVLAFYQERYQTCSANPSALHKWGQEAAGRLLRARRYLARIWSCKEEELLACSGATEAINTVVKSWLYLQPGERRGKILISQGEHAAVQEAAAFVAGQRGWDCQHLPLLSSGSVDLEALEAALDEEVFLVCCMHVNNETGAINPVEDIGALVRSKAPRARFLVDEVQAFGKLELQPLGSYCDYAIFAGHKIHAPRGIGLLFHRSGQPLLPLIHGGRQQANLRSGTEDPTLLECFCLAAKILLENREEKWDRLRRLEAAFLEGLEEGTYCLNSPPDAAPGIMNISFPGLRSETLLNALSAEGVYASASSSCHSRQGHSAVLAAMGLGEERLNSALRFSFDAAQTEEEVREAARICRGLYARYRL